MRSGTPGLFISFRSWYDGFRSRTYHTALADSNATGDGPGSSNATTLEKSIVLPRKVQGILQEDDSIACTPPMQRRRQRQTRYRAQRHCGTTSHQTSLRKPCWRWGSQRGLRGFLTALSASWKIVSPYRSLLQTDTTRLDQALLHRRSDRYGQDLTGSEPWVFRFARTLPGQG